MASHSDEIAIRLRRAAFNRALADADLAAIRGVLAPAVVLVTGTDSAVLTGARAQLQAWQREFAAPLTRRAVYVRTPAEVTVSGSAPVAMEHGAWTCTAGGVLTASGRYAAKWRKLRADWMIEAEIFVTLG